MKPRMTLIGLLLAVLVGGAALALWIAFLAACWFFLVRTRRCIMAFSASILYLILLFAAIITDICFIQGALP